MAFNIREYQRQQRALREIEQGKSLATVAGNATDTVLDIALQNDINRIRSIESRAERAEYKRNHFLPKWLPLVDEYINNGKVYQNDILGYCIIYSFDTGNFETALSLADIAIGQSQMLPANFKSSVSAFVADQILAWAENVADSGQSVEPYFSQTFEKVATAWRLHEVITAKWYKFAASLLLRNTNGEVHTASIDDVECLQLALWLSKRAKEINHKCGINTLIDRIYMRLRNIHPQADHDLEIAELSIVDVIEKLRFRLLNKTAKS